MVSQSVDLVILRHGEAEPYINSDAERELTSRGREETRAQIALLAEQGFQPEEIIHSPFTRTTQTAGVCHEFFPDAKLRAHSGLMHSAQPEMVPLIWGESNSVLLASHMPLVARLLLYLCPTANVYGFNVSGYARVEVNRESLESVLIHDATGGYRGSL